jgi:hypothetical protein
MSLRTSSEGSRNELSSNFADREKAFLIVRSQTGLTNTKLAEKL